MLNTSVPPAPKIEWVLWTRSGSRTRWRPVMVVRTEREVIHTITSAGHAGDWWDEKGHDPHPTGSIRGPSGRTSVARAIGGGVESSRPEQRPPLFC
jgi:hypothetical protein